MTYSHTTAWGTSKTWCSGKDVRHKRPHIVYFYFNEMSRIGPSIYRESRLELPRTGMGGGEVGVNGSDWWWVLGFFLSWWNVLSECRIYELSQQSCYVKHEMIWFLNYDDFVPSFLISCFYLISFLCFGLFFCFSCLSRHLGKDRTEAVRKGILVWLLPLMKWLLQFAVGFLKVWITLKKMPCILC